ncbi:Alpha/Beta hydrolase protein [Suillus spraguei]|nr:Alpha/Beta hydrolase protein [Suillus spraguei]
MIDYLLGRPSPSWKRTQVFLVIIFWIWRLVYGNPNAPRFLWLRRANRHFGTLTAVYAVRNLDKITGFGAPEPLARLVSSCPLLVFHSVMTIVMQYSPSYYRATWIAIGLDAGFATAMSIRPKWLKDFCSILFSIYYIIYANEADEKIRRYRAVPTVEMLRSTWEKTTNPYLRLIAQAPQMSLYKKFLLPRPSTSTYDRPLKVHVYFAPPAPQLQHATDLILDFPGGGFVAMTPEHHDERLRSWALRTGKPVLSVEYGKAPEYPYPFAIDECFDVYQAIVMSTGRCIGMSGKKLNIILTGDSAASLPAPIALVLSYAALDFNFTSWMSPENLQVLRSEQSSGNLPGIHELASQKDHLQHVSPLSMVGDRKHGSGRRKLHRRRSWKDALLDFTGRKSSVVSFGTRAGRNSARTNPMGHDDSGFWASSASDEDEPVREEDRPLEDRVRYVYPECVGSGDGAHLHQKLERQQEQLCAAVAEADNKVSSTKSEDKKRELIGTRLTMTSRTGYFQDRIIPPSMVHARDGHPIYRSHHNPDFATDYFISPILTPAKLLAQFPPLLMQCGEKDPFVDDTVIFAGRVREAKRAQCRFGETLQMSSAHLEGDEGLEKLKKERDELAKETEDDWVQMVLFSDWSHGYLQMMSLMSEARAVVEDLADWMEDAFVRHSVGRVEVKAVDHAGTKKIRSRRNSPQSSSLTPKQESGDGHVDGSPSPFTSETETDDSGITFVAGKRLIYDAGELWWQVDTATSTTPQSSTPRGGNGKIGQRITESELLRRRRLLDAHIFEGQG